MTGRPDLHEAAEALRADPAFTELRQASARLGRDPLEVQGAGGNTSIKADGAMWVKASGTWLADAETKDIMVPVAQADLVTAIDAGGHVEAAQYALGGLQPEGVRPSIETTLHAVLPHRVVIHTHSVPTLALAVRSDGEAQVRERIADLDPVYLPYLMPGLPLARALRHTGERRVVILGNHGLLAGGATVEEAEALIRTVSSRLAGRDQNPGQAREPSDALETTHYTASDSAALHAVARDPERLAMAARGPFYPDHVVFLGAKLAIAESGETVEAAAARIEAAEGAPPVLVMLPGHGAAIRRNAGANAVAMARCLGDVVARVAPGAPLQAIPADEVAALLGWDAEKHRQAISRSRA